MHEVYRAKVNREGRMVIPAAVRAELGIDSEQEVFVELNDRGMLVYTPEAALKRLQTWVADHVPAGRSLVDELIADRRAEAAKEFGE